MEIKVEDSMQSALVKYVTIPSTLLLTTEEGNKLINMMESLYEITGVQPQLYMNTKSRETAHVRLRQIAAYCMRQFTRLTLREIGIMQGFRDHSTVIHSCKIVEDWMSGTPGYSYEKKLVESIMECYGKKCEATV
jgi:chromosomal replication initiation ATPase DnaA